MSSKYIDVDYPLQTGTNTTVPHHVQVFVSEYGDERAELSGPLSSARYVQYDNHTTAMRQPNLLQCQTHSSECRLGWRSEGLLCSAKKSHSRRRVADTAVHIYRCIIATVRMKCLAQSFTSTTFNRGPPLHCRCAFD